MAQINIRKANRLARRLKHISTMIEVMANETG